MEELDERDRYVSHLAVSYSGVGRTMSCVLNREIIHLKAAVSLERRLKVVGKSPGGVHGGSVCVRRPRWVFLSFALPFILYLAPSVLFSREIH
jgi:hypothetical protein